MPEPKKKEGAASATLLSAENIARREGISERANKASEATPPAPPAEPGAKPAVSDFPPAAPPVTPAPVPGSKEPVAPTPPVVTPDPGAKPAGTPPEKKGEEQRMVPLEALHESREKLKAKEKELSDIKEQNTILLKDLRELMTKPKGESEEAPVITDYDKKLVELENELKVLREKDKQRDQLTVEEQRKQAQQQFKQTVDSTEKVLETEGFHGFKQFLPLVTAELFKMAETDKELAASMDNPEGWKKIFKEIVHPQISGFSQKKNLDDKTKEKEALKEGASLLMPAGNPPPATPQKEEDWSFDKYMEERRKHSVQPQSRGK